MSDRVASWHARSGAEALEALGSGPDGLTDAEAEARLQRHGPNRLTSAPPASALGVLVSQFRSVVIGLLVGAMLLSLLMGDRVEMIAIAAVIALNTGMGFLLELRARRAMEALGQLVAKRAVVVRGGQRRMIDAEHLVPGDVIELSPGQTVPADGRVLAETDLRTNEAALTGESLPVSKQADVVLDPGTPLADHINRAYQGTTVAAGLARMLVTETGNDTEVGRIGTLTQSLQEEKTPLERRLDELGQRLVWVSLGVAAVVAALGLAQGERLALMVETAIALAVAAVPEGLPAVATITLALGLRRLAQRRALVRRLPAVESLGSTTIICSDKTRTLTSGDMTVVHVWTGDAELTLADIHGAATVDPLVRQTLETAGRASRLPAPDLRSGQHGGGDPVDLAVFRAIERLGLDTPTTNDEAASRMIPFSSERKFLAVFDDVDGDTVASVKGAPGRVVEMSGFLHTNGGRRRLDVDLREQLLAENRRLAAQGLRVLGVASGDVATADEGALKDLTFAGFIGLMDPPAEGVREAIALLRQAGLRTVMLTGDQRVTAEAVGRQLGVLSQNDEAIDSRELKALTPADLAARLPRTGVFSRIEPEDKLTIVGAFQARGEVVAMLGDGVNDAPALRKADVGVAMGIRGTDVAKEAASIVLQDDRFETIVAAVEEGRVIFDNIRKFVFYLFSCNLAEVLVLLVASISGLPLPLLPLQILWLNMVTDTFPALALAVEPGDVDVMQRPPRDPRAAILSRPFLVEVTFYALLITSATLGAYVWALSRGVPHATTVAFMTLALAQTFHLGNARSTHHVLSPSTALANRFALGAVALSVLLQLASIHVEPIAVALRTAPLDGIEWAVVLGCSALPAIVGQTVRLVRARTVRPSAGAR